MDDENKKNECGCNEPDCPVCNPVAEVEGEGEEGCDCASCPGCGE